MASARYCSEACRVDAYVRAGNVQTIRYHLEERDGGRCAICGRDPKIPRQARLFVSRHIYKRGDLYGRPVTAPVVAAALDRLQRYSRELAGLERRLAKAVRARLWDLGYDSRGHNWEADHVEPVAEGGGGCGLAGYRTLCLPCHKAETAALAARRAALGRLAKGEPEQLGLPI